jgi:hypothetical protein
MASLCVLNLTEFDLKNLDFTYSSLYKYLISHDFQKIQRLFFIVLVEVPKHFFSLNIFDFSRFSLTKPPLADKMCL